MSSRKAKLGGLTPPSSQLDDNAAEEITNGIGGAIGIGDARIEAPPGLVGRDFNIKLSRVADVDFQTAAPDSVLIGSQFKVEATAEGQSISPIDLRKPVVIELKIPSGTDPSELFVLFIGNDASIRRYWDKDELTITNSGDEVAIKFESIFLNGTYAVIRADSAPQGFSSQSPDPQPSSTPSNTASGSNSNSTESSSGTSSTGGTSGGSETGTNTDSEGETSDGNSLELYYAFNESTLSGNDGDVIDSSGKGRHGTSYNVQPGVEGVSGTAFEFQSSKILGPKFNELGISASSPGFTISLWLKHVSGMVLVDARSVIANGVHLFTGAGGLGYQLNDGNINDRRDIGTGVNYQWHHVAWVVTFGQGSAQSKLYFDHTELSSLPIDPLNISALFHDQPLTIGESMNGLWGIEGSIDELKVFSRPLTADEISSL